MKKSTKSTYKPAKKGNYKSVVRMAEGGNVSELNYSERREYIEENYAPFITDAQMIFTIYDSGIEYDYKGDRKQVTQSIIEQYKSLADYTEATLPQETIYEIQDWDLVRKEIDPDTDEVIGETPLEELSADNTYNFSYNGLVDLNWRVYHDKEYDRFFYVITPHLGGDIRGNYGDAIILEGNDKDELFYRYYEGFISGGASVYLKFKDGSEVGFDSEQDSDVFYFRVSESFEPTGMAQKYLEDFEQFETWYGDEFLEETIDIYSARKGVAPMMMAGGSLNDETPMAYIQILGYDEGKYFNLTDYADGQDVIDGIYDMMNELNEQLGGNREEYEVTDYEGFGDDLYDRYMGANEFDEIIEAYEKYVSSDFPADVISAYKEDSGSRNDSLSDVIDEMDNNYFGKYDNLTDFGYEMVEQGVYEPSENDVYITDTDKRILAGEESDNMVVDMSFDDLMNVASDTKSEYEDEKSELEDKISEITDEINDLMALQNDSTEDEDEYERISEEIESKEVELDDTQNELDDIDGRFEDKAREEARESFYDEIYDRLENDLDGWLSDYGYDTGNLADVSFLSVDYEKIGDELSSDYLIVEFDGNMYFFNNYANGGRITASKRKPKFDYYIVENSTKKLVSGYSTKVEANEQRKLLVQEYPSMRFEIYTLSVLEAKTDLDVYAKKDYVELSTLDKIKKVSVDAYRYGQEKVGQAQVFLERNDVKGKIKRGTRKVADKTKQGASWLQRQWREADFGDGKGKAKFFAEGGGVEFVNQTDFSTEGDYDLEIDDFIDKLKIIHNHINFDEVAGESDSYNTDLKFFKNSKSIAYLVGSYNEKTERYDSEFIINDYSTNINFHPYNSMGGIALLEFDLEIKNAVSESKTYSAVVSIEGYEVEGQEFTDEKRAETSIKDLKEKTHFNLVRGKKFGQGKRVEQDRVLNKYADGGGVNIGFIPMDLEEKLALLSKWGGTNIKGVIGYLNAMIDSGLTDNDLVINPTKNTRFQRERAVEKKIKEIWEKIEPQYKGNLKGNMYYSTLKELIERNYIYENLLQKFKPYRKYQKFDNGGGVAIKQNEGKLFNEKGEMLVYKKQSDTSTIYDVDVYEPIKTDVKEYSKFKYCKREKNGRECVYRLDKKSLIEMIKKEKFIYSNGGGVEIQEMPTRERTITRPTTTPTEKPTKPDRDNPYKPKYIPKPKANKYNLLLINKEK